MKKQNYNYWFSLLVGGFVLIQSCGLNEPTDYTKEIEEDPTTVEVTVEAENFTAVSDSMGIRAVADMGYVQAKTDGWIALDIDVPVAGRYQSRVSVSSDDPEGFACWLEDYRENKDGRTYNITGSMSSAEPTSDFVVLTKDGSPLNKGLHKMKLHLEDGMKVDWVAFSLMKEHDVTPSTLTQKMDGSEWKVVWADEFDGDVVDTTKWTYDIGNWGWGNNELQYYTKQRTENARIEDGNLIIEARKGDMGEAWTSARLTTRGKTAFLYGKIEFRAKVPAQKGNWAAGWTLGDDYVDELSWPYCGEIDIMESVGFEMDDETGNGKAHASVHCGAYYFKLGNQPTSTIDVENMQEEYHTYAVEWTPEGIVALIDDKPYFSYEDTSTELAWPFSKSQNIILNLAMGGGWGGAQGMDESVTSQKMIIDYVRVYERS